MRWLVLLALLLPWFSAEARARPPRHRSSDLSSSLFSQNVIPTLGLSFGESVVEENRLLPRDERLGLLNFWAGLAFYPRSTVVSPFLAGGLEIGVIGPSVSSSRRVALEVVPAVRMGFSAFMSAEGFTFPGLELYGIAGYRIVTSYRDWSPRLGAGISIPAFAYVQIEFWKKLVGVPLPFIPWMAEFTYDASPRREISFRVGYHI